MKTALDEQRWLAGLPELSEENLTGIEPSEQKKVKAALEKAFKQIVDLVDPKGLDPKAQFQFTAYLRVLIDYFMGGLYEQVGTASGLPPLTEAEKVNWEKLAKRCCNLVDAFKSLCDYAVKADKGDAASKKNFTDLLNLVTHDYAAIIQAKDALMYGPGGSK